MKSRILILFTMLVFTIFITACANKNEVKENTENKKTIENLEGPYFGQSLPGKSPEKFAAGVISKKGRSEFCPMFSPDGNAFYFTVADDVYWSSSKIMVSYLKNNTWSTPESVKLGGKKYNWGNCFSPDGNTMFFNSANDDWDIDIYYIKKDGDGWGDATLLSDTINSVGSAIATSVSYDGTLFFRSSIGNFKLGKNDIFYSQKKEGNYITLENIGYPISTDAPEDYPTISPDGSYLIYYTDVDSSSAKINISFKLENDLWTAPIDTGLLLHSGQTGGGSISPDGKYFLYQGTDKDIYWVDLEQLIDSLND